MAVRYIPIQQLRAAHYSIHDSVAMATVAYQMAPGRCVEHLSPQLGLNSFVFAYMLLPKAAPLQPSCPPR